MIISKPAKIRFYYPDRELWTYLADLNEQAGERLDLIMEQMKAAEGVTDESVRRESPVCPHHVDTFA